MTAELRASLWVTAAILAMVAVALGLAMLPSPNARTQPEPSVTADAGSSFPAWISQQMQPAIIPEDDFIKRGQSVFLREQCGACHTVRGLPDANGRIGPDLTHVGSRQLIAGGALKGGVGNFAAWIASAQHLKPGNKMPSFDRLSGIDLRAVASYLDSLK